MLNRLKEGNRGDLGRVNGYKGSGGVDACFATMINPALSTFEVNQKERKGSRGYPINA